MFISILPILVSFISISPISVPPILVLPILIPPTLILFILILLTLVLPILVLFNTATVFKPFFIFFRPLFSEILESVILNFLLINTVSLSSFTEKFTFIKAVLFNTFTSFVNISAVALFILNS